MAVTKIENIYKDKIGGKVDKLKRHMRSALLMAIFVFMLTMITVATVIFLFGKESLDLQSYEIYLSKQKVSSLESLRSEQNKTTKDLTNLIVEKSEIPTLDALITKSKIKQAIKSKEDSGFFVDIHCSRINSTQKYIQKFNKENKNDEFIDEEVTLFWRVCYPFEFYHLMKDKTYETTRKEVVDQLFENSYLVEVMPEKISTKITINKLNEKILKKIEFAKNQVGLLTEKIDQQNKMIIEEEKRLEGVGIRTTSIMIAKGTTLLMFVIIILSLLSVLRYLINIHNKAFTQLLILEEDNNNRSHEVLALIAGTSVSFDNKAEDVLAKFINSDRK